MSSPLPEDAKEDVTDADAEAEAEEAVDVHLQWQDAAGSQTGQVCIAIAATLSEFKAQCAQMLKVRLVHCPDFNDDMDSQQLRELGIGAAVWTPCLQVSSILAALCASSIQSMRSFADLV